MPFKHAFHNGEVACLAYNENVEYDSVIPHIANVQHANHICLSHLESDNYS